MKKNLRNSIQKAIEEISDSEQTILALCSILCVDEGVNLRNLIEIIEEDSHAFRKEMKNILRSGLLVELPIHRIYCPKEIKAFLSENVVTVEVVNSVVKRLEKKTVLSIDADLLQAKPYFGMAMAIMNYIVLHPDDRIDYEVFASLLVNITRYYEIYAQPDLSIFDHSELKIVKAIRLAKSKLHDDSLQYARMCTCEANILLNGWWYEEAKKLLDESLEIISKHANAAMDLAYTYLMQAYWHEQYGQMAECLKFAYKSWEVSEVSTAAIYIAYQLSILELKDDAMHWIDRVDVAKYPDFSIVSIFFNLATALIFRDNYTLSTGCLSKVEITLDKLNPQAAFFDRIHYTKSLLTCGKESEDEYYKYMSVHANHYASSDGAKFILAGGKVRRYLDIGAQYSAKVAHESLKDFDVTNPKYSLSVKTEVCLSQIMYFRSVGDFVNADKFYTLGKEYTQQALPSDDTLSTICQIFDSGEVPASISGENDIWLLEYQQLLTIIAQDDGSHSEVMEQIKKLKKRFPEQLSLLDAISINYSFEMDSQRAIKAWRKCIREADETRKHEVAIMCARLAISRGLYRQANSFFEIGLGTEEFRLQHRYKSIPIWLEYVLNLERCGYHRKASNHWEHLDSSAARTDQLCDVYQAKGNSHYDKGEFTMALKEYEKFLSVYQREAGMIDERLSSVYAYQTVCYTNLAEFRNALKAVINAKECSPMLGSDGFTLEYNHAYILIALGEHNMAYEIIKRIQTLTSNDEERDAVYELYNIYRKSRKPSNRVGDN